MGGINDYRNIFLKKVKNFIEIFKIIFRYLCGIEKLNYFNK